MFRTITPSEMKRIETAAIAANACTGEELMQRAAAALCRCAAARMHFAPGYVLALCGVGNNGGDAMAALRMLGQQGLLTGGCCLLLEGSLTRDAQRELERLRTACPQVELLRLGAELAAPDALRRVFANPVSCIIDGLFGTGLSRPPEGAAAEICHYINAHAAAPVVAVDIPSGLCGRTGQPLGVCLRATETVTFHRAKQGLFLGSGMNCCGAVTVADIGLPAAYDDADGLLAAGENELSALRPAYAPAGHKGDHGRVALLCGSKGMAGAAALAATAALRTGAGLVTVACPERILDTVQQLCPCATCLPLPEDADAAWQQLEPLLAGCDAMGMGCGLGQSHWAAAMVEKTLAWLTAHSLPAVIDADALNLLSRLPAADYDLSRCVLTPHPGEAARLLGLTAAQITADAPACAARLVERYGAAVVLKGAATLLIHGNEQAVNLIGTPAMGKGGSGDVLTGVLCALMAGNARQAVKQPLLRLMQAACGLHGAAGKLAEKQCGTQGVLATDLCRCLATPAAEIARLCPEGWLVGGLVRIDGGEA